MFNIYMGIFILVAIAVIAGGTYKVNELGMTAGAFVFFAGSLALFITYGIRWFAPNSIFAQTPVSWPPTLNSCPDYLTFYGRTMPDGTKKNACVDMIGVSKNGSLKVFPRAGGGAPEPVSDEYYFSLETTSTDPASKNNELCQRAMTYGLTWEGITNGESCILPDGELSKGTTGSSTAGCPATVATPSVPSTR